MRLREALMLACGVALVASGCSRLTFVKPNAERKAMERVAPEYSFRETESGRRAAQSRRLLVLAQERLRAGDVPGAVAQATAAQKVDPASADPHTLLGLIANQSGDAAGAGRHFARATELAPRDGAVLGNYGAWLCDNGRASESLAWFERAVASAGQQRASSLGNASACALKAGQTDLAHNTARAALDLDPSNPPALATLAEQNYAQGRYLEARAFSERRLAAAPVTPEALRLASQIEQKLGDTVAATRYVQRLRTEFPQARTAGPGEAETP